MGPVEQYVSWLARFRTPDTSAYLFGVEVLCSQCRGTWYTLDPDNGYTFADTSSEVTFLEPLCNSCNY